MFNFIKNLVGWFARFTTDKKAKADIEVGEAFLAFYPILEAAFSGKEGQDFLDSLEKAFKVNVSTVSSPKKEETVAPLEAGSHGGSMYTGEGSIKNNQ